MLRLLAGLVLLLATATQPAAEPDGPHAWLDRARVQSYGGAFDASARSYSRYLEAIPDDPEVLAEYARVLWYRGDYPRALDAIERHGALVGETPEYRRVKANVLAWADRPEAALAVTRAGLADASDDAELICAEAVASNRAREFRRSLERLDACERLGSSASDVEGLRTMLSRSLGPLGIRAQRHRVPYRPDWDWEPVSLLAPAVLSDVHYRGDTEHVHAVEAAVTGWTPIHPELLVGATIGYEHLWGDRDNEFGGRRGDVGHGYVAAELEARLARNAWLGARVGGGVTTEGDASPRYRVALDVRPTDAWQLALVQEHRIYAYSARTVERDLDVNRTHVLVHWAPDLHHVVEGGVGYDFFSDENEAWHVFVEPRRAVLRRQRLWADVGLRAQWFGFADQGFDNGYYDPDLHQRYVATLRLRTMPREKLGLDVYAAGGVGRDERSDGLEPVGDLFVEAVFGEHRGWLVKLRAGATATTGPDDDFWGWTTGLRLVRRF